MPGMNLGLGLGFQRRKKAGGAPKSLQIAGSPVLTATQGSAYAGFSASASGGVPPYSYSLVGAWPVGIAINSSTGAVTGTPTASGSFAGLSVRVTDAVSNTVDLASFTLAVAAAGGFPRVITTATFSTNVNVTSSNVSLPTSVQPGDLLLMLFRHSGSNTLATTPSGWTRLVGVTGGGATHLFYKIADGSEGATVPITHPSSKSSAIVHRIAEYSGVPEAAISVSGVIDPPPLSPSWGFAKTLFFAMLGSNVQQSATAIPGGYSNLTEISSTGSLSNSVHSSRRELEASSDDPSAFAVATTVTAFAITAAVRP